jgi:low-density lipoprotein receptor class A
MRPLIVSSLSFVVLATALARCTVVAEAPDDGVAAGAGGNGATSSSAQVAATLNASVILPNEGMPLNNPKTDTSVVINTLPTEAQVLLAGDTATVSIPFSASQGNVVAAGIRFGTSGPIRTVMLPAADGQTNATLTFQMQLPASVCDDLANICHSIVCYEFAVTDAGLVSRENIMDITLRCGGCDAPSCQELLPPGTCMFECSSSDDCSRGETCSEGHCVSGDIYTDPGAGGAAGAGGGAGASGAAGAGSYDDCLTVSCSDGTSVCASASGYCDGVFDCRDQSDEGSCVSCASGHHCGEGRCVPQDDVCDGVAQCSDDECGCDGAVSCGDGSCMPASARCDGNEDCFDLADELGCSSCSEDAFACGNGECIDETWRCNGVLDCGDESDETACPSCDGFAILSANCAGSSCHGAGSPFTDFAASEDAAGAYVDEFSSCGDYYLISSSDPGSSYLLQKVNGSAGCGAAMPIDGPLSAPDIACIERWLRDLVQ